MQFLSVQSKLLWLFLPSLALAATPLVGNSTSVTSGQLQLVTAQSLNDSIVNRAMYCRKNIPDPYDPDDPGWPPDLYTTSLNNTLQATPPIDKAFLQSLGFVQDEGEFAFDCFLELPGGVVTFEIKGEIESNLRMAYRVYVSVLAFTWLIGQSDCSLLDVEEQPCEFTIDKKYIKGQGKLYSQPDPKDPDKIDLCVDVEGSVKLPFSRSRSFKHVACFLTFHRHDDEVALTS